MSAPNGQIWMPLIKNRSSNARDIKLIKPFLADELQQTWLIPQRLRYIPDLSIILRCARDV
ncbi:MAG: hypothetical protein ABIE07_13590 [Candidatus Zixiibacteriota bacterium]